jgi:hypothetical protein
MALLSRRISPPQITQSETSIMSFALSMFDPIVRSIGFQSAATDLSAFNLDRKPALQVPWQYTIESLPGGQLCTLLTGDTASNSTGDAAMFAMTLHRLRGLL